MHTLPNGATAVPLSPLHYKLLHTLMEQGEINLLAEGNLIRDNFYLADLQEAGTAILAYNQLITKLTAVNCKVSFFGFRLDSCVENNIIVPCNYTDLVSSDKQAFLKKPAFTFLFQVESIKNNQALEIKYHFIPNYPPIALASMLANIWITAYFDQNQPIPWEEFTKL